MVSGNSDRNSGAHVNDRCSKYCRNGVSNIVSILVVTNTGIMSAILSETVGHMTILVVIHTTLAFISREGEIFEVSPEFWYSKC